MLRCEDIQDFFFHDSRPVAGFIRIFDNVSQGNMVGRDTYYLFHDRVTLFFADNFSMECRITMIFLHNFF